MGGWIKLYRKSKEHWLYNEKRSHTKREAWEDMLLLCNHEDNKVLINGELIDCKRGQSVMSLTSWAKEFKWSRQMVRSFFELLKSDSMINTEGLRKSTRITICNYDIYQNNQPAENTEKLLDATNRKPTDNHKQECKELKNITSPNGEVLSGDPETPKPTVKINYENLVEYWNKKTKLNKIKILSEKRKATVRTRIKEHGKDFFKEVVDKASESNFLNGENDRGWKADFDWIMRPTNFVKILEGNYDNDRQGKKKGTRLATGENVDGFQSIDNYVNKLINTQ
jgi:DNA replication protein DnaD